MMGWRWLSILALIVQVLVFKIGIRWSDSLKRFESSVSAADMISWFHSAIGKPAWVRAMIDGELIIDKIYEYYLPEPNSDWLVSIHVTAVKKFFTTDPKHTYRERLRLLNG